MQQAVENVSENLFRALHYRHSQGRIVPSGAFLMVRWWSNVNIAAGQFPENLGECLHGRVELRRENVDLGDQFTYRYGIDASGELGAYLIGFGTAFAIMGVVCFDPSLVDDRDSLEAEFAHVKETTTSHPAG